MPLSAGWRKALRLLPLPLLVVAVARTKPWTVELGDVSALPIVGAVLLNLAIYIPVRALRWRCALASPPAFLSIVAAMLEGIVVGTAVGFGSGDAVRAARLRGDSKSFVRDYGATMAERAAEVLALAILLLLAAGVGVTGWWAALLAVTMIGGYLSLLFFGARTAPRLRRWPRLAAGVSAMLEASTGRRVAAMTGLGLAGWSVELGMLCLCLRAFHLPSDFGTALVVLIGINLAIAIPGPPANLGTFEAGVVGALLTRGLPMQAAMAFALAYHVIVTLPVVVLGGAVLGVRQMKRR